MPELKERTPLLTQKHKKAFKIIQITHSSFEILFWRAMKQIWIVLGSVDQRYVWMKKNEAYEKNTIKHGAWCCSGSALNPLALETCRVWKIRWIH